MPINDKTSRVVKMFCSNHSERPALVEPYVHGGYIYATDSFTAIRVPTSLPDDEPEVSGVKFPLKVLEPIYEKPVLYTYIIRVSQLDTLFECFKKVPVLDYTNQVECPKCHGDGEVECSHCNHDYECPNCDGEGTVGKPKATGEMEFDSNIYAIIKDTTAVSASYLLRIREVAKELNQDTVKFQWIDRKDFIDPIDQAVCYSTSPLFCEVDDAMLIIMPIKHRKDPKLNAENIQVVTL